MNAPLDTLSRAMKPAQNRRDPRLATRLRPGDVVLIGALIAAIVMIGSTQLRVDLGLGASHAGLEAFPTACASRCLEIRRAGAAPEYLALDHIQTSPDGETSGPAQPPRLIERRGPAGITVIEIAEGRVRCLRSPGAQRICERAGWLEAAGDTAISLPNRLRLTIIDPAAHFDAIHF